MLLCIKGVWSQPSHTSEEMSVLGAQVIEPEPKINVQDEREYQEEWYQ